MYDLVVLGGGAGGLNVASAAARVGARVALVVKHQLGGECTHTACVPSKSLLQAPDALVPHRDLGFLGTLRLVRSCELLCQLSGMRARHLKLAESLDPLLFEELHGALLLGVIRLSLTADGFKLGLRRLNADCGLRLRGRPELLDERAASPLERTGKLDQT